MTSNEWISQLNKSICESQALAKQVEILRTKSDEQTRKCSEYSKIINKLTETLETQSQELIKKTNICKMQEETINLMASKLDNVAAKLSDVSDESNDSNEPNEYSEYNTLESKLCFSETTVADQQQHIKSLTILLSNKTKECDEHKRHLELALNKLQATNFQLTENIQNNYFTDKFTQNNV